MAPIATVALLRHGGSHLIRPIVAKMGFEIIEPGNFGAPLDQAIDPIIIFLRDPRNRMVATMRWWRGKPRKAALLTEAGDTDDAQLRYLLNEQGFLSEMLAWAKEWCRWRPGSLTVHFEHMDSGVVGYIAHHLGLEADEERDESIFGEVYGSGRTYTGNHSKWKDSFGPLSISYWNHNGGNELLSMMGYV